MRMVKASDIRRLLQAVYKPVVPSPEFKERLLKHLLERAKDKE